MGYTASETELCKSPAFLAWRPPEVKSKSVDGVERFNLVGDKHFTASDVAQQWGVSEDLIRDIFRDEDGVLIVERPGTRTKRAYSTMRIPESVLERVYNRLSKR